MKLNNKRVLLVGFAFFLICAFWQAYDAIIPLMLVNKFGLNQTWSGLVMALDNILALFLLPLFGALSDKTKTKYGKRTPYIFMGTVVAVLCFVGLTFVDNAQLNRIAEGNNAIYWESNETIANSEYNSFTNNDVAKEYSVRDYASRIMYNKEYSQLTEQEQTKVKDWYNAVDYDTKYYFDKTTDSYALQSESGDAIKSYANVVSPARSIYASKITDGHMIGLVIFMALLLLTLLSMATFRSPAVALMPDITIKPLRSKANAIINIMGSVGGVLVLGLGMVFGTGAVHNQTMSYTTYVIAVCAIMLIGLAIFITNVKEKHWNEEMLAEQAQLDNTAEQKTQPEVSQPVQETKLSRDKLKSLILIMASVALWFMGYNAITTKYSLYAVNVLQKDYNLTLIIAQAAAIVSYIPVGMLASRIGRKKTILLGIALLTVAFGSAIFVSSTTPIAVIWILFSLAGIAWATINVNSFPMVVELSSGGNIGKFTGYYYTASMAAQTLTPLLSGLIMDSMGNMSLLFPYGATFVAMSFVTMLFVKHGDSKPTPKKSKLEMIGDAD